MAAVGPSYSTGYFPKLTGKHGVGVIDVLHNLSNEDPLLVRLYYPTKNTAEEVPPSQLVTYNSSYTYRYRKAAVVAKSTSTLGNLLAAPHAYMLTTFSGVNLPALPHAPLLEGNALPVVVFSHGLTAMRSAYSLIHCDLASHGYIVAAVEHKDGSACLSYTKTKSEDTGDDGPIYEDKWIEYIKTDVNALPLRYNQVKQRASEMSLALDFLTTLGKGQEFEDLLKNDFDFKQFKDRIDLDHVAAMGHSYGGGTTVVTLANDLRFRCGVALDTWMFPVYNEVYDLVKTPLVFINSWDFQWAQNVECMMKLVKEPDETGFSTCQMFTIRDSNHLSHCDKPFLYPSSYMKWLGYYSPDGDIYEVHDASLKLTYAFLDRHLWNDPSPQPILDGGEGQHRLVMSGTNIKAS
jgi:platelet-activating factor acetylhydrolase